MMNGERHGASRQRCAKSPRHACRRLVASVTAFLIAVASDSVRADAPIPRSGPAELATVRGFLDRSADAASELIRSSGWHDGSLVSPTLVAVCSIEQTSVLVALCEPIPPRGGGVWATMRAGRSRPSGPRDGPSVDAADSDLDLACAILVREALIAQLDPRERIPAEVIARVLRAMPRPPTHPAADPALVRWAERIARLRNPGARDIADARCVADSLPQWSVRAEEWRDRFCAMLDSLSAAADGPEGRAIIEVFRADRLASAGWPALTERSTATATATTTATATATASTSTGSPPRQPSRSSRPLDHVHACVQLAMRERPPCAQLAEILVETKARSARRIESVAMLGNQRVVVGFSEVTIPQSMVDRWRLACGLKRTSRGWEGLPARPRARPHRLRDVPFWVNPPRAAVDRRETPRTALGYAPDDVSVGSRPRPPLCAATPPSRLR